MDPAFADALSEIELDFFRTGDELEIPMIESWDHLVSKVTPAASEPEDDDWEWAIAIARARHTRASTAH